MSLAWRIELTDEAVKQLGHADAKRIGDYFRGRLGELWRYRVGHYRIIASLEDEEIRILVVRIAHRHKVYR